MMCHACAHPRVDKYECMLTFVRVRRPCVSTYRHVYVFFFKHHQPPHCYPLALVYVCAQSLLGSHRVNRSRQTSTLCVCLPANPYTSTPPSESDIKQMKWTHIPSRRASIWKHEALMRSPSALLPHSKAEEMGGKKWKDGAPMGCCSNDRFVEKEKVLHARQKHKDTFHHQRNVSKSFTPQIRSLLFLK